MRPSVLWPPTVLLASLHAACGMASTEPGSLSFERREVEVPGGSGSLLTAADLDGDGVVDLVAAAEAGLAFLGGDGEGGFRPRETRPAGPAPVDVAVGDVDADGRPDFVVANHGTQRVTLLLGGDEGPRTAGMRTLPVAVSPHVHAVAWADVDGDGVSDLVVDDRDGERLVVRRGGGDASFGPSRPVDVGGDPYRGFELVDLDGDAAPDAVAPLERSVAVRWNEGDGRFRRGPRLEVGFRPFSVSVGDFDGDGTPDVAAGAGEREDGIMVWRGAGGRSFEPAPGFPLPAGNGPVTVGAVDLDGDGADEVLGTAYQSGVFVVLSASGHGRRLARVELGGHPWGIATGDFDGDGRRDVAVAGDGPPGLWILANRAEGGR